MKRPRIEPANPSPAAKDEHESPFVGLLQVEAT
jgi:hypothetical protein